MLDVLLDTPIRNYKPTKKSCLQQLNKIKMLFNTSIRNYMPIKKSCFGWKSRSTWEGSLMDQASYVVEETSPPRPVQLVWKYSPRSRSMRS